MARQIHRVLLLLLCMAAFCASCGSLLAQTQKTITLRMMDGKTGKLIATSDFLVRIDHQQTVHANWVTMNEDGTGKLTLPGERYSAFHSRVVRQLHFSLYQLRCQQGSQGV